MEGIPVPLGEIHTVCAWRGDLVLSTARGVFVREGAAGWYPRVRDAIRRHRKNLCDPGICPPAEVNKDEAISYFWAAARGRARL